MWLFRGVLDLVLGAEKGDLHGKNGGKPMEEDERAHVCFRCYYLEKRGLGDAVRQLLAKKKIA